LPELTPNEWENFLAGFPEAHILQTRAWGDLKSAFGWKPRYLSIQAAGSGETVGAQILFRLLPFHASIAYIAKGPVGCRSLTACPQFWHEVDGLCEQERAIFLILEPDLWEGDDTSQAELNALPGFEEGFQTIQPRRTLVVDLQGSEEQVLARMKQKTRYNIRLAQKKGILVHASEDIETFHRLIMLTGERDVFGVHSLEYYRRAYDLFSSGGDCILLQAELEGEPVAAMMAFRRGSRAWYFYGASGNQHRERMPTYLLQWEAMRWGRACGCTSYDLWGVPDVDEAALEAEFTSRTEGLWGVYRFKRGFGGELKRSSCALNRIYRPMLFSFYKWWSRKQSGRQG
jgi:lipid II:glycine glycyltransferase (peptidoglycan interpeptide bridge formation enzyme)